jgi:uncharacterized protein YndB with AHSA1/START domain
MDTDRISKQIVLRATRERVWKAISDHVEFGTWFGVEIDGPFVAGTRAVGRISPTKVDPDVARLQEPHRGAAFLIEVDRIEPMRLLSFRWHPYAIDQDQTYDREPMTLVTFELADVEAGILLTVTETGFDRLPAARRSIARDANDGGWEHQTRLIARYLDMQGERSGT